MNSFSETIHQNACFKSQRAELNGRIENKMLFSYFAGIVMWTNEEAHIICDNINTYTLPLKKATLNWSNIWLYEYTELARKLKQTEKLKSWTFYKYTGKILTINKRDDLDGKTAIN